MNAETAAAEQASWFVQNWEAISMIVAGTGMPIDPALLTPTNGLMVHTGAASLSP